MTLCCHNNLPKYINIQYIVYNIIYIFLYLTFLLEIIIECVEVVIFPADEIL